MRTAVLVDDEPHLLDYLADQLAHAWPELRVVGRAQNGRQALSMIQSLEPDVVFLDIQMPGMSGLEVAGQIPSATQVVFVTAYDQFAVQAFEKAAVDYLLKPVAADRLQRTVERLRQIPATDHATRLEALLQSLKPEAGYLRWLRTGLEGNVELVGVDQVVFFKAQQKYTSVMTATQEYLVRMSIKDLAAQLDPNQFWQIHRALIVQVAQIASAKRDLRGRYAITLHNRDEVLRSSQRYGHLFKQM